MRELVTNKSIFDLPSGQKEGLCVTTNGQVKNNGWAVMGKGIAYEADQKLWLAKDLGYKLRTEGNHCYWLGVKSISERCFHVFSFPTKNHWRFKSDLDLIEKSCIEMLALYVQYELDTIYLPPPGCGCGGLNYEWQVKPLLQRWLTDNFVVVRREEV